MPTLEVTCPCCGEVYQAEPIGGHRLLCGDSTNERDVAQLMQDDSADAMWTDPPYGVSYVGKTADALTIENDGAEGLEELLADAFGRADDALKPGAPVYVAHPAGALSLTFLQQFLATGWRLHETLIWVKDSFVLGRSDYHYQHEPILYGYTAGGEGRRGRGGENGCWYGDNAQASVFQVARPKRSVEHPTQKPVPLVAQMLHNSTLAGQIVYEPFGGSGSTLIACERLRRRCYVVELSPVFADVILRRWEKEAGRDALLLSVDLDAPALDPNEREELLEMEQEVSVTP